MLIGSWRRQRAARKLAEDGSVGAIRSLAEAVTRGGDERVRAFSLDALRQLARQDCIDAACAVWESTRNDKLATLLADCRWVAGKPTQLRVLTALKIGQLEVVTEGGAEVVEPLIQACTDADAKIAQQARQCLVSLLNSGAIDAICARWMKKREDLLAQAVVQAAYVAERPTEVRVLSALKVGRLEVVTEGGAEMVEPLVRACEDSDPDIAEKARPALKQLLKSESAQEALCSLLIERDHPFALEIALEAQFVLRDVQQQALFYFLTEQWDKYQSLDIDRSFLRTAYETGDERLRTRITEKARQAGRIEWVEVVSGRQQQEMSDDEWRATLDILFAGKHWEHLWQEAQDAPPRWSTQVLRRLNESEWTLSKEDEREECGRLIQLSLGWEEPKREPDLSSLVQYDNWLNGHDNRVTHLAISPDGRLLATGSRRDGKVLLWSLPDGKLLKELKEHLSYGSEIVCLAITFDGRILTGVDEDGKLLRWSLPDGAILKEVRLHSRWGRIKSIAISPDGRLLASGNEKDVRLWRLPDDALIEQTQRQHRDWASKVLRLCSLPVKQTTRDDWEWVKATLSNREMTESERKTLELIEALMHRQHRA